MSEPGSFLPLSYQQLRDAIIMWIDDCKPDKSEIADLIKILKRNLDYKSSTQENGKS